MSETLYQVDAKGKMRYWAIWNEGATIHIEYGQEGGVPCKTTEVVACGLAGRDLDAQVRSRISSRINKQLDRGYKSTRGAAVFMKGTNSLGFKKPMLAQSLDEVNNISFQNAHIQPKYNGHRCLITNVNGQNIAYSRQGKLITSISHILDYVILKHGQTIDGELYCHGVSLQRISSWVKRFQEASRNLQFMAYDMIDDLPFNNRILALQDCIYNAKNAVAAPTTKIKDQQDVRRHLMVNRAAGYEGAILRWGDAGYENGKRSKHLVKVKQVEDMEFFCVDIEATREGWGVLILRAPNGKLFKCSAPGGVSEKIYQLKNRDKYINRWVTVEYANMTASGIPFHPVALQWREDV